MKIKYIIYYIDYSRTEYGGAVLSECERCDTELEATIAVQKYIGSGVSGSQYTILKVYY